MFIGVYLILSHSTEINTHIIGSHRTTVFSNTLSSYTEDLGFISADLPRHKWTADYVWVKLSNKVAVKGSQTYIAAYTCGRVAFSEQSWVFVTYHVEVETCQIVHVQHQNLLSRIGDGFDLDRKGLDSALRGWKPYSFIKAAFRIAVIFITNVVTIVCDP